MTHQPTTLTEDPIATPPNMGDDLPLSLTAATAPQSHGENPAHDETDWCAEAKANELAFMTTKDEYSAVARALGFEGDAFFGDPLASHQKIVARAKEMALRSAAIDRILKSDDEKLRNALEAALVAS